MKLTLVRSNCKPSTSLGSHSGAHSLAVLTLHIPSQTLKARDAQMLKVEELLDVLESGEGEGMYLYDLSMPKSLPGLLEECRYGARF